MKKCNKCGIEKNEIEFNIYDKRTSVLGWCKDCFIEYDKYYKQGKVEYYPDWHCECGCDIPMAIKPSHRGNGLKIFHCGHGSKGKGNPMFGKPSAMKGKHHTEATKQIMRTRATGITMKD